MWDVDNFPYNAFNFSFELFNGAVGGYLVLETIGSFSSLSLTEGDLDEPILNDERLFLRFSLCFSMIEAISSSVTDTRLLPISFRVRWRSAVISVEVGISTCGLLLLDICDESRDELDGLLA